MAFLAVSCIYIMGKLSIQATYSVKGTKKFKNVLVLSPLALRECHHPNPFRG